MWIGNDPFFNPWLSWHKILSFSECLCLSAESKPSKVSFLCSSSCGAPTHEVFVATTVPNSHRMFRTLCAATEIENQRKRRREREHGWSLCVAHLLLHSYCLNCTRHLPGQSTSPNLLLVFFFLKFLVKVNLEAI